MKLTALILSLTAMVEGASWRAGLAQAEHLRKAGQTAAAERVYQQILETNNDLEPMELNSLATELFYLARYSDAEILYRRALEGWDRLGPEASGNRGITAGNLGTLLKVEGRYPEAESLLLNWIEQAEAASGPDGLDTGRAADALAALYLSWGQPAKAESMAVRANAIFAGQLEFQAPERTDNARLLASIWLEKGRYTEAEALLRPLVKILPDRGVAGVYNELALAEARQHHLSEAETLYRSALELARRVLPPQHPLLAVTLNNLAQVERSRARYLEAETDYREAIGIWQKALGPKHPDVARGLMNLAAFYHERGREAGAEELYREAAAIFDAAYGRDHLLALEARIELAEVLRSESRFSESERLSRAALDPLARTLGDHDPRVIRALANYARLLEETRRSPEAAAIRGRIEATAEGLLGESP